jgi:serine/threonine protein kinase
MPAPATNEELFALIAKSGVLDDARVKAYLAKLAGTPGGVPAAPAKLAGRMVRDGVLSGFQAENLLQGRWKRFFIGKYKVLERLGVGGMGQVFLCEHKLMKRRVAVKVLPAAKAKDPAALQRFYREARAVAALDHPNIVRAYDIDDDGGLHFLVMEFVDGTNLHDLVRKGGPLPVPRACHYVFGTAVGLQHAHEHGLVHRDIKPANILIDRTGVVKVLDLGLARFFDPDEDDLLTKKFDEAVLGTADYLSPEQAIDSSGADIRADIYGLGGTFYFLLTGRPPFPDGTIAQKLLHHQSREPEPIPSFRSDVHPALVGVVARMMAKDPAHRYQTPAELMAALAPWVQTPIPPPPDHEMPQLSAAAGGGRGGPGAGGPSSTAPGSGPVLTVSAPPAPTPASAPTVKPMATAKPVAAPRPPAPPPATPAPNVWESLTAADTPPPAGPDTTRDGRPLDDDWEEAGPPPAPPPRRPKKPSLVLPLALVAGGLLLLLAGGAAAVLLFWKPFAAPTSQPGSGGPAKEREPRIWYVTAGATSPDPATTRKAFLDLGADLRSGDTVVFLDDEIESLPIRLASGRTPLRNVTLAAGNPAKSVRWTYRPVANVHPRALLDLADVENVTVRGLVIDAANLLDAGVTVSGVAGGVELDGVSVFHPRKTGVRLVNTTADPARPLKLTRCRVVGGPTLESGVHVLGSSKAGAAEVRVVGCRFEGAGKGEAIRVEGAVAGCEVRDCRVYNFEVGVAVPTVGDGFALTVERNTFHTLTECGLKLDHPLAGRSLTFAANYLAATREVGRVTGDAKRATLKDNGRDAATKPGQVPAAEVKGVTLPKPAPDAPDDQFLRPSAPLVVGPDHKPVGAG